MTGCSAAAASLREVLFDYNCFSGASVVEAISKKWIVGLLADNFGFVMEEISERGSTSSFLSGTIWWTVPVSMLAMKSVFQSGDFQSGDLEILKVILHVQ